MQKCWDFLLLLYLARFVAKNSNNWCAFRWFQEFSFFRCFFYLFWLSKKKKKKENNGIQHIIHNVNQTIGLWNSQHIFAISFLYVWVWVWVCGREWERGEETKGIICLFFSENRKKSIRNISSLWTTLTAWGTLLYFSTLYIILYTASLPLLAFTFYSFQSFFFFFW